MDPERSSNSGQLQTPDEKQIGQIEKISHKYYLLESGDFQSLNVHVMRRMSGLH